MVQCDASIVATDVCVCVDCSVPDKPWVHFRGAVLFSLLVFPGRLLASQTHLPHRQVSAQYQVPSGYLVAWRLYQVLYSTKRVMHYSLDSTKKKQSIGGAVYP